MMTLDRAPLMQPALCLNVSGMCLFWRVKPSKMKGLVAVLNSGAKLFVGSRYAKQAATFVAHARSVLVLPVDRMRCLSQVANAVVRRIAIDVVNEQRRVDTKKVKPSQPVREVEASFNANLDVTGAVLCSGGCTDSSAPKLLAPSKDAGIRVVIKKFAHLLRGKIGLSHEALLLLIGQRPHRVGSTLRPRHFSAHHLFFGSAEWQ